MAVRTQRRGRRSLFIAGTAVFSALVAAVEYLSLAFPVLRISFIPPLTYLKFDMAEIPAFLSFFVFGLPVGIATSLIVPLTIIARGTSNPLGAVVKGVAVLSTMLGFAPFAERNRWLAGALGLAFRVLVMGVINGLVLPLLLPQQYYAEYTVQLLSALFNALHAVLTIGGAYIIYWRLPSSWDGGRGLVGR
jgi:riboflavin transporter FmnP